MIRKIFILPLCLMLFAACDDFLDIRTEATAPTTGIDYSKVENVFQSLSAAYASMRDYGAHAFPYIGAFEIASDNADKGSSPEDNPTMLEFDMLSFTANNSMINDLWIAYYKIVSAANFSISQMPLFEEKLLSPDDKTYTRQCAGEAKLIRAYAYFNLTRLFGRVPIIDKSYSSEELARLPQATTAQLYDFIESDLQAAIDILPTSYSKSWAGRYTQYTAMALKAKVHLYQKEWDDVALLTGKIIGSGKFSLLPDFSTVFAMEGENSPEMLMEIQSSTLGASTGPITYVEYAFVQGPRGNFPSNMQGWGFCTPSDNLISFFKTRNETVRSQTTLLYRGTITPQGDSIITKCVNPVYNGKVYTPSSYNIWNNNGYGYEHNVRLIRYADVLLMYAEAKAQGSTIATDAMIDGTTAFNLVRTRAHLPTLSAITPQIIWDERRAELAMEEDRYFDLIRTAQASTALAGKWKANKHEHYPIPNAQIQLNNALTPNPGY